MQMYMVTMCVLTISLKSAIGNIEGTMKDASFWNHRFRDTEIWAKVDTEETLYS